MRTGHIGCALSLAVHDLAQHTGVQDGSSHPAPCLRSGNRKEFQRRPKMRRDELKRSFASYRPYNLMAARSPSVWIN